MNSKLMTRAWAAAMFLLPFIPAALLLDSVETDSANPLVMPESESDCPPNYTPTNFKCFGLPNNRTICGMARPTTDENCKCGVYKAFYRRKYWYRTSWFFADPPEYMCTVLGTCNQHEVVARSDVETQVCDVCRATGYTGCYKFNVMSQRGAVLSILQRAKENLNVARQQAAYDSLTLISLDRKELPIIKLSAESMDMVHNDEFVIEDFTSPSKEQLHEFVGFVRELKGDVIVHCGGGMGRTGLFLIALKTRLLLEEERKRHQIPLKQILAQPMERPKNTPRTYSDTLGPIADATEYVQQNYHIFAGEFRQVPTNFDVLLELVNMWSTDSFRSLQLKFENSYEKRRDFIERFR